MAPRSRERGADHIVSIALSELPKDGIRLARARRCECKLEGLRVELLTRSVLNVALDETSVVPRPSPFVFNVVDQVTVKPVQLRSENAAKSGDEWRIPVGLPQELQWMPIFSDEPLEGL